MKIRDLKIEGFRSLKSVEWKPGDVNMLIGPNAGGKSNLLQALEMIAESDLVAWLLHPNELGGVPDGIELAEVIEREEGDPPEKYRFYVFKFRTLEPHWMARHGWVAGVAGPYWDGQDPDASPPGVFSEFEPFNLRTPAEHLARIEQIVLRKLKWRV